MAIFRVEHTRDYVVMSNYHLRDKNLSLKAKGLLSQMLSLPPEWDYTLKGLAAINKEGVDAIRSTIQELEKYNYLKRSRIRNENGQLGGAEYIVYERPMSENPTQEENSKTPMLENPTQGKSTQEKTTQYNIDGKKYLPDKNIKSSIVSDDEKKKKFVEQYQKLFDRRPDNTLLGMVKKSPPENLEQALHIAKKHKPQKPAAYLTAVLKKMLEETTEQTPPSDDQPLADWELQWLEEVKRRRQRRQASGG